MDKILKHFISYVFDINFKNIELKIFWSIVIFFDICNCKNNLDFKKI